MNVKQTTRAEKIGVSSESIDNFKTESESGETAEFYINTEDAGEYTCYELGNELTKITEYSGGYFCSSRFVLTENAINILLKKGYPKGELFEITLEVGAKATIAFREVLKEFCSSNINAYA